MLIFSWEKPDKSDFDMRKNNTGVKAGFRKMRLVNLYLVLTKLSLSAEGHSALSQENLDFSMFSRCYSYKFQA